VDGKKEERGEKAQLLTLDPPTPPHHHPQPPTGVVGDMRASMLDEVDFRKEANNLQAFGAFLDTAGLRSVATCPFVYKQFSSKR
jgi:predicted unusual protein kinase regulating ubiquinone biosynthesis (AarF/ABC1/UbiB family)